MNFTDDELLLLRIGIRGIIINHVHVDKVRSDACEVETKLTAEIEHRRGVRKRQREERLKELGFG